jgi:hypothetical protein
MEQLTDTDIYYLLLSALSSPAALLFACTAFLVLVFTLGMVIGIFRTVGEMKTDCKEILKNK